MPIIPATNFSQWCKFIAVCQSIFTFYMTASLECLNVSGWSVQLADPLTVKALLLEC